MPSCIIPTCKNAVGAHNNPEGITFHVFPADEKRRADWTKIIQRARLEEFWKPSKRSVICSIHFEEKYLYDTKRGLKRLKKEAIPSKYMALASEKCMTPEETPGPWISRTDEQPDSPSDSSSGIGDVQIPDLDCILETPRAAKLNADLRRKEIILKRHVRKIKTLQQKYKRLVKRNESLKCIIRNLRNNRQDNDDIIKS